MPPLPADSIHARACKLKCEKILTRPETAAGHRRFCRQILSFQILLYKKVRTSAAVLMSFCLYCVGDFDRLGKK